MSGTLGWVEDRTIVSHPSEDPRSDRDTSDTCSEVEFWCGQPSRLHDRYKYTRDKEQEGAEWKIERLAP